MKVLKFGGTSVGSTENIRIVKKILESQDQACVVVVSAFGGVTDQIIKTATMASERDKEYRQEVSAILNRHREAVSELIAKGGFPQLLLQPVNFNALYTQQVQQRDAAQSEQGTAH